MATELNGVRVAVIVADGFEQREFEGPVQALRDAGAQVDVLAPDVGHMQHIRGFSHFEEGPGTKADVLLEKANVADYDGLLIPGGCISPDTMRQSQRHLDLVKEFASAGKPIAAICHGPWLLADAGIAQGHKITSWPGIRKDLERAGATWQDAAVLVDGNLVTSRKPDDVPAFAKAFIDLVARVRQPAR